MRIVENQQIDFCIDAVKEAIDKYGPPKVFNTDKGPHFTSRAFTGMLETNGVLVSMDGQGRYQDNIFIERL